MGNIFDYVRKVEYDSSYDRPFTELDMLVLTELAYLPFDNIVSQYFTPEQSQRLVEVSEKVPKEITVINSKERFKLLDLTTHSKRYKNIKLSGYINDIDHDIQKQFAAILFKISLDTYVIAFRGTDDSIIGWKEDFHMSYMEQVPAQLTAKQYVEEAMQALPQARFILTGHSKGGNLATYAASQIAPQLQERIDGIYSFDAPGLNLNIIQTDGYQAIAPKIKRFIPQGSLVGMMLELPKQASIVKSVAIGGFAQHNTFSWQVEQTSFQLLDTLNPDSIQTDKTLKEWVDTIPDEELKDFFDTFFGLILDAGIQSIDQLFTSEGIKKAFTVLQNAHSLEKEKREMLFRLARLLIDMRYQYWIEDLNAPNPRSFFQDVRTNLSSLGEQLAFFTSSSKKEDGAIPDTDIKKEQS